MAALVIGSVMILAEYFLFSRNKVELGLVVAFISLFSLALLDAIANSC